MDTLKQLACQIINIIERRYTIIAEAEGIRNPVHLRRKDYHNLVGEITEQINTIMILRKHSKNRDEFVCRKCKRVSYVTQKPMLCSFCYASTKEVRDGRIRKM